MAKDLLLEIGSEELPAGFIPVSLEALEREFRKNLEAGNLTFKGVRTLGTPRRLTIIVEGVAEKQADAEVSAKGPAKKAAFDADGKPTKALLGFARSKGVDVSELKTVSTDKGEYLYAEKLVKGEETKKILPAMLASIVKSLSFPKAMRWGAHSITYARPVHWILALYGQDTVRFEFGHVKSNNTTRGHRFIVTTGGAGGAKGAKAPKSSNAARALKVTGVNEYLEALAGSNVIADPEERKRIIAAGIEEAARKVKGGGGGGRVLEDPALLDEVTNLVEYPVVLLGSFDREFLDLPGDVVVNAMREHQRYFSVVDNAGGLLPHFITVANTETPDPAVVVKGNQRVLKARLNDAKFYFEKDRAAGLTGMLEELKGVVFQAKLGTSYEKVLRFAELSLFTGMKLGLSDKLDAKESVEDFIGEKYNPARYEKGGTDPRHYNKLILGRAAMLAKADLTSGVVGEFPKLQGVMGMEYARLSGEVGEVSRAILEHYRPVAAGAELPASDAGAVISIADKLDTIAGCFGVALVPTGAQDPYALRRQALGIIAIILDRDYRLALDELIDKSLGLLGEKLKRPEAEVRAAVLAFFRERLKNLLLGEGLAHDAIEAVLSAPWFDIVDSVKRVRALEGFKKHPDCASLVVAFKRVSNILKGFDPGERRPDPALFEDPHEKALFELGEKIAPVIKNHWQDGDYEKVFTTLASVKETVDKFFDEVMVMAEVEALRTNRLLLLSTFRGLYYQIADLSKLST